MKYQLTVEERQLRIILDALDMYSRMGMGQLDVAVEEFLRMHFRALYYEKPVDPAAPDLLRGPRVRHHIDDVKALVFGHPPNGSWGIRNDKVPQVCREAYDLQQVFRKVLAEQRLKRAEAAGREDVAAHVRMTVDMDSYYPTNPDWPPATARAVAGLSEQELWNAYREDPRYRQVLQDAGVAGPRDIEAALTSEFVVSEGDGTEDDPPIYLGEHVLHTLAAFAAELQLCD